MENSGAIVRRTRRFGRFAALVVGLVLVLGLPATALAQWDDDFYYDPGSPCAASICDDSFYSPSDDYYFDPGSSCDASICDAGYYDPSGDFYYDPGSSTDSNLVDTSSEDWGYSGDLPSAPDRQALRHAIASSSRGLLAASKVHRVDGAAAAVASATTFVDRARSYRLVYPRTWQRFDSRGVDFAARAPDRNAAADALAINVPAGQSASVNQVLQEYFQSLGVTPVTGQEQTVNYLGDVRQAAEVEFRWNNTGAYGGTVVVMITSHRRLYLLAGSVADLNAATTHVDALTISSILSSIDVLHTLVVPKHLAAKFTDKTHSYRLTYSKTWTRQHAPGLDLFRLAPDKAAALVSLSVAAKRTKTVTLQNMHDLVGVTGRQIGTVTGRPIYHAVRYQGVLRRMVSFTFKDSNGLTGKIFLVAAVHHGRICVAAGVVFNTAQAIRDRDAARVSAMLSSLAFV